VLLILTFSKFFYMACLTSYYTFFLIHKFGVSVQASQIYLFVFLAGTAAGTFFGGPIGDRFGRKLVLWFSILGVLPFTLALPYADLFWTGVLTVIIGAVMASAFSTIVVFAQELMPGNVGTSPASSSAWRLEWAASARRCSASSPTQQASSSSSACAPFFRSLGS
jgi:FSR family fosmidomycin resistance protein-like MFS transporter